MSNRHLTLFLVTILLCVATTTQAQIRLLPQKAMRHYKIPRGNYSGITPLGNNHYAIINDKQKEDGYYEFLIEQNDTTGQITNVQLIAFHGNGGYPRDAEGIVFFPDSNTVFISAEDDQRILEYDREGQRTGRFIIAPAAFAKDSIYHNYGFEALTFDTQAKLFWTTTENSLLRDGVPSTVDSLHSSLLRFQSFGTDLLPKKQYTYYTDPPTIGKKHTRVVSGVPTMLALGDGNLLVLERDVLSTKLGIGNRVDSRLYLFSPEDSTKVLQTQWTSRWNLTDTDFANYEGMCFGATRNDGKQTILLVADSQNWAGNFMLHLEDFVRVGVLNDDSRNPTSRELLKMDAQLPPDSIIHIPWTEKVLSHRWTQSLLVGVPLIVAGLLERDHDKHFRSLRNDYTPRFKSRADDYIAVIPVLVTAGLKFAGNDGSSEWPHRVVSGLFSFAITAATIRPTKALTSIERPDGSGASSFPSNHAAFVFGATARLVKEYGDLSPWIGYGGYTLAAGVCAMRVMNNRHWLSDVLVGAGIGMISTEFSYWLADLCCPRWANTYRRREKVILSDKGKPHFLDTYCGFYLPFKHFSLESHPELTSQHGATLGIEGAYFINRYVGFGGQMSISDIDYADEEGAYDYTSYFNSIKLGVYAALPLCPRVALGAKAIAGYAHYPSSKKNLHDDKAHTGVAAATGLSLSVRTSKNFAFKVACDYEVLPSPAKELDYIQSLVLSGGAAIRF